MSSDVHHARQVYGDGFSNNGNTAGFELVRDSYHAYVLKK